MSHVHEIPEECVYCDEPVRGEAGALVHTMEGPRHTHWKCGLREVVGGIGHLIAHDYWCVQRHDPDAGLTRFQSAQLVFTWVSVVGTDEIRTVESD